MAMQAVQHIGTVEMSLLSGNGWFCEGLDGGLVLYN